MSYLPCTPIAIMLAIMSRNYQPIIDSVEPGLSRPAAMRAVVDGIWDAFANAGVSWVGFYLHESGDELVLDYRRDKPACSPIGMHGACGKAFKDAKPLVVRDVKDLGENYVACDPRDRSEVVLPCIDATGKCWGVLDLDSFDIGAFDDSDVNGLTQLLRKAGLTV